MLAIQGAMFMPGDAAPVIVIVVITVALMFVLLPLARAYARRLESKGGDPALRDELMELRERIAELEAQQGRVLELEERLEFAERLLSRPEPGLPSSRRELQ
jgi:hypothetical protein